MKKFSYLMLASLMTFSLVACGGEKVEPPIIDKEKIVEDISIKTAPKTNYILGEQFEITGGVIELHYEDGTTGEIAFTDEKVTVTKPDMTTVGTKSVNVEYDGFVASYQITVSQKAFKVTLDLNYEGAPASEYIEVEEGKTASTPKAPTRKDHKFLGWFKDKECTESFDFSSTEINANITIYAKWVRALTVTFDLGSDSPIEKEAEENAPFFEYDAPSVLKEGFQFLGWYDGDTLFDFSKAITTSVSLKAKWKEIPEGTKAHKVTIDYNDGKNHKVEYYVANDDTTFKPSDLISSKDKKFLGWFDAKTGTTAFDFTKKITSDTTIYAHYEVSNYVINFKYVIDGVENLFRNKKVQPGEKTSAVLGTPKVDNYKFDGVWYLDKEYKNKFDFNEPINSDLDLYTKPLKKNTFEAEYVNIDPNKPGVGSSDTFSGLKLIFEDNGTANASNGYWVSGLYNKGSFIEFVIHSSKAFDDAVLEMSLSAEWTDMYLAPKNTTVNKVNYYGFEIANYKAKTDDKGEVIYKADGYAEYDTATKSTINYSPIALTGAITFSQSAYDKRPFTTHFMTDHFSMNEGYNVVRLEVTNSQSPFDGTMNAYAPMIDNLMIYTDSTLSWTPKVDNVSNWEKINFAPNKH